MSENDRSFCEDTALEERAVALLLECGFTLTTAESCTAGLLAGRVMNVAGASAVYNEGYITYSNEAKERVLNVRPETLEKYGAVSSQTACEMAQGAALVANADAALSVTGIAGPGGGTKEKPVGLVYIGCYLQGKVCAKEFRFSGNRAENRRSAVSEALKFLLQSMEEMSV